MVRDSQPGSCNDDSTPDPRVQLRVSFVCSGNICRSPTAEVVMRHLLVEGGLADRVVVESAGTGGWHAGEPADRRSAAAMADRGYDASGHRARQFDAADFDHLDLVVAMDRTHERALRHLAGSDEQREKVVLLGDFGTAHRHDPDVPDPYYGGRDGFSDVLDRVEDGCRGLLETLRRMS